MDVTLYRGMLESLLYLTISRPDIILCVCLCARYQADPRELHLLVVKHIMQYPLGTPHQGLWILKSNTYSLLGY